MSAREQTIPAEVRTAVREALRLIEQTRPVTDGALATPGPDPLPSLLEQCGRLAGVGEEPAVEPIRTIHHFACTGGTLITKCLACSANIQVLSELDPLSSKSSAGLFNPTDLIQLLQHGNRGISMKERLELFMAGFSALYDSATRKGLRLLIRDHTHSHFCVGGELPERPTLQRILSERFTLHSVLTVRNPLDSWLSLVNNGWVEFMPDTLDEYARRYLAFLDAYSATRIFKYEDFVENPDEILTGICAELRLPVPDDYQQLFGVHNFSGDSGRRGAVISSRERRPVTEEVLDSASASRSFQALCDKLHYSI